MSLQISLSKNVEKEKINKLFEMMCRCCCAQQNDLKLIFEPTEPAIDEMIFTYTEVRFSKDDSYPQKICLECLSMLNNCSTFRQQVQAADKFLKEFKSTREEIPEEDEKYHQDEQFPFEIGDCFPEHAFLRDIDIIDDSDNDQNGYEEIIDVDSDIESPPHKEEDIDYKVEQEEEEEEDEFVLATEEGTLPQPGSDLELHCDICKRKFSSKLYYRRHMDVHNMKTFFSCDICYHKFPDNLQYEEHMKRHRTKMCAEMVPTPSEELQITPTFNCLSCEETFIIEHDLDIHSSLHFLPNDDKKYSCKGCTKLFETLSQLKRHLPTHYEVKPYKCEECGKGFPEMASLTRHEKSHKGIKKDRNFSCTLCEKKYFDAHSLKIHRRSHTGEKPHCCDTCSKTFSDVRLLNSHKRTHLQEKTFVCDECGQRFNHHSTLISHIRTHTGEKPYTCVVCSKSFIQVSNLRVHMRTHSGERPYSCTICGDSFTNSSTLKVHSKTHAKGRYTDKISGLRNKFKCGECDEMFPSKRKLHLHENTHNFHKDNHCTECNKSWSLRSYYLDHMQKVHDVVVDDKMPENLSLVEGINDDVEMLNNEALVDALLNSVQAKDDDEEDVH